MTLISFDIHPVCPSFLCFIISILGDRREDSNGHTQLMIVLACELSHDYHQMSRVVRKPDFCICENKDADQLRGNREADQRLCFRYTDSTIPLLYKSEMSSR